MDFFLHARPWQLFIAISCALWAPLLSAIPLLAMGGDPLPHILQLLWGTVPTYLSLGMLTCLCYLWAIGLRLQRWLPNTQRYGTRLFLPAILLLVLVATDAAFSLLMDQRPWVYTYPWISWVASGLLAYCLAFCALVYRAVIGPSASSRPLLALQLLLLPVSMWWLQPHINTFVREEQKVNVL